MYTKNKTDRINGSGNENEGHEMGQLAENYNEQSLIAVVNRINSIDVLQEPLLVGINGDKLLVHERNGGILKHTSFDQRDGIVEYNSAQFKEKFGDQKVMTIDEYISDQKILSDERFSPLVDEKTRSQFMFMKDRIEEVAKDVKAYHEQKPVLEPTIEVPEQNITPK